jgi:hypothetical protein
MVTVGTAIGFIAHPFAPKPLIHPGVSAGYGADE